MAATQHDQIHTTASRRPAVAVAFVSPEHDAEIGGPVSTAIRMIRNLERAGLRHCVVIDSLGFIADRFPPSSRTGVVGVTHGLGSALSIGALPGWPRADVADAALGAVMVTSADVAVPVAAYELMNTAWSLRKEDALCMVVKSASPDRALIDFDTDMSAQCCRPRTVTDVGRQLWTHAGVDIISLRAFDKLRAETADAVAEPGSMLKIIDALIDRGHRVGVEKHAGPWVAGAPPSNAHDPFGPARAGLGLVLGDPS